ncbi:MAG TPA: LCP family protein [Eggerthellaceae bacterium]|nr:LCP family protein [Eggerthellaceae bacterium]
MKRINQASQSASRTPRKQQSVRSYDRSSYGHQGGSSSSQSRRNPVGAEAYSASNYGSSTHRSTGGYVPVTPAGANQRYAQNAKSREFVRQQHERKKKSKRKRIALISLAVVCVLMLGGIGAAWAYITQVDSSLRDDLDADLLNSLAVTDSPSDPFYMLLIGADKSEDRDASGEFGGSYRTDSMILARVDPQEKEVTLISVPRDTRVNIPGHGEQKINAAYAFGGASLAVDTVSELAGVPISHYAEIDFDGFKAVVDALGGVEVDVPMEINDDMAGGHVDAGLQTLNGEQALILCRSRHNYDDIGNGDAIRAANQRLVLSAIMKKVMNSDVATITNTVSTLAEYVTTDYSVTGLIGLAQSMMGIDVSNNVYTAAVPTTSVYEDNLWWEVLDEAAWEEMMNRVKQGLSPTEETQIDEASGATMSSAGSGGSANADGTSSSSNSSSNASLSGVHISVKNGSGISGCANEAAAKLTPDGAIIETGNADDFNYSQTIIVYENSSQSEQAQKIADLLGVGQVKQNDGTYAFSGDFLVVVGSDWG